MAEILAAEKRRQEIAAAEAEQLWKCWRLWARGSRIGIVDGGLIMRRWHNGYAAAYRAIQWRR